MFFFFWGHCKHCKRWIKNYCISTIEHDLFDASVCGLCECATEMTSLFWCKALCQWVVGTRRFGISTLSWDIWQCSPGDTAPYRGKTRCQLPENVMYISKRICQRESYSNSVVVSMLVKFVSSCPKQHCALAPYLSPFVNPASVLSGCHSVRS